MQKLKFILNIFMLTICLLLSPNFVGIAQNTHQGIPFVKNYLPSDYNGNSQNWSIIEDNRGVFYFGNTKGILEFDGTHWNFIDPAIIYTAAKDGKGTVFMAGEQDYGYLDADKTGNVIFKSIKHLLPDSTTEISDFHTIAVGKNEIYFGERGGKLHIYNYDSIQVIQLPFESIHLGFIDNTLYISANSNLYTFKNNKLQELQNTEELKGGSMQEVFKFNGKLLLVSRTQGIYTYDGKKAIKWEVESTSFLEKNQVYRATKIDENHIAFGTVENGVLIMDNEGKSVQHINTQGGMINHDHCEIYTDSRGNIWSGLEHGISHIFINSPFTFHNQQSGLNNAAIYSIQILQDKLYLGTAQGIMYRNLYNSSNPLSRKWRFKSIDNNLARKAWDIYNNGEQLLTGMSNNGTFYINKTSINKALSRNTAKQLIPDSSGQFLICTKEHGGLFVMKKNKDTWESTTPFAEHLQIKHIAKDKKENFWVFSKKKGLLKISFNDEYTAIDSIVLMNEKNNLANQEIIAPFNIDEKLFFGTKNGTYSYNKKDQNFEQAPFLKNKCNNVFIYKTIKKDDGEIYFLGKKDGIDVFGIIHTKSNTYQIECITKPFRKLENFELSSLYAINSNTFLFGCIDRLIVFDKKKLSTEQANYPSIIRSVEIIANNDSLIYGGYQNQNDNNPVKKELKFKDNALRFKYAATYFDMPEKTKYSYRLKGYNNEWSPWSTKTEKEYSYLKKSSYDFIVKAKNIYGEESKIASYSFSIAAPWYNCIASWIAYAILIVIIGRYIMQASIQKERVKNQQLEELIGERTEEIAAQRDEIMNINTTLLIQQKDLSFQNEELSIHKKKILDSLDYAKQIQQALLPQLKNFKSHFTDSFIFYRPKDTVSGDFYWLRELNNCITFAVADCTGHGVPGAFMSIMGISQMNEIVQKKKITTPSQTLEELRKEVKLALNQENNDQNTDNQEENYLNSKVKDGIDIAFCSIDKNTNMLQYAGANIPLLIIRNKNIIELKPTDNPIGIYLKEVPFTDQNFQLESNDIIYIFSDGYADQFGGKYFKKYYMENFKKLLLKIHQKDLCVQNSILKKTMNAWQGSHEQIDDMLIMGIKI